ncbi:MAG: undecaprenyl-phosphate glucose phosphotransferase [Gallionella sp.]
MDKTTGLVRPHSSRLAMLQRILDAMIIYIAMLAAIVLRDTVSMDQSYLTVVLLSVLLFLLVAESRGLYKSWRTENLTNEVVDVVVVWSTVLVVLLVLAVSTKTSGDYSRVVVSAWSLIVPFTMVFMRMGIRSLLRKFRADGRNTRTVAFAGNTSASRKMAAHIRKMPWMGLRVAGVFDDRSADRLILEKGIPLLGTLQDLVAQAKSGEIDIVYVTLPMHAELRIIELMDKLGDTTACVFMVPDLFVFDLFNANWSSVAGMPVVSVYEDPFFGIEGGIKRLEDLFLGSVILALVAPLMLWIALGVKVSSRGPVLFKQRRYGLNGQVVEVWKFRSMTACDDGDQVVQAKKNDARVTPFGAFLRRTSLDELPQFLNVLQGQMSIVGPRPHAVAHNEEYRNIIQGYMLRHKVKPGITGWAQINGWRGETDTLDKMQSRVDCDLAYVRNWSLLLDLKIIFKTAIKGFAGKNAY